MTRQSSASARGNVVIMIPKKLRMDWVDTMAIDERVSHTAFRAACVIGKHFNNTTGETFVGFPKMAKILNCHEKTARRAVQQLEELGFLEVKRMRGRGKAHVYRPAVDGERATATAAAQKLDTSVRLLKAENRTPVSVKPDTSVPPTLTPSSKGDSAGGSPDGLKRRSSGTPSPAKGSVPAGEKREFVAVDDARWPNLNARWRRERNPVGALVFSSPAYGCRGS